MSIPAKCTVLVIGGGPGGSYTASALAREGIDTVLLEADFFPRYHVGESMVPSLRYFLRFIDLDETFVNYGFVQKTGASFKLNRQKDAYTNFIESGNEKNWAWNVIRSEMDNLIFQHAGKCGAKTFDGVRVKNIEFVPSEANDIPLNKESNPGRPVSATWSRKDGSSGEIKFDYVVDASGKAGMVSTKYMNNRVMNEGLKNVASWGYWKGATKYGAGTFKEGQPFFEALQDGSGWCWMIPLHNDTMSIGVVMDQAMHTAKKKASASASGSEFYVETVQEALGIAQLLSKAELVSDVKHAGDWSYQASSYASPYLRIVGDAGCFIDPYFSSGVHLALSGALTAAVTICASIRGDCQENEAAKFHSDLVNDRYTRFLLVVLSTTKQIRAKEESVLNEENEEGFDNAFSKIKAVIQGKDVEGKTGPKTTKKELAETADFTLNAIKRSNGTQQKSEENKENETMHVNGNGNATNPTNGAKANVSAGMPKDPILKSLRFAHDKEFIDVVSDGLVANLERGSLGLRKASRSSPAAPGGNLLEIAA